MRILLALLVASAAYADDYRIEWDTPPNADGVRIYLEDDGDFDLIGTRSPSDSFFEFEADYPSRVLLTSFNHRGESEAVVVALPEPPDDPEEPENPDEYRVSIEQEKKGARLTVTGPNSKDVVLQRSNNGVKWKTIKKWKNFSSPETYLDKNGKPNKRLFWRAQSKQTNKKNKKR